MKAVHFLLMTSAPVWLIDQCVFINIAKRERESACVQVCVCVCVRVCVSVCVCVCVCG